MPNPKPVIGVLGAPGSGKSTVARAFEKLGCAIIDADQIARALLDDPAVRETLVSRWGNGVLNPDGHIDRPAVGKIVFADPEETTELTWLESILHPRVQQERDRQRAVHFADPAVVAVIEDVPLLLEKGLESICDALIYVDTPRDVRLARVSATRGWSEAELTRRENLQLSLDIKRQRADHVMQNSGDEQALLDQARQLLLLINPTV